MKAFPYTYFTPFFTSSSCLFPECGRLLVLNQCIQSSFASVHHHSKSKDQDVIQLKFKDLKKSYSSYFFYTVAHFQMLKVDKVLNIGSFPTTDL